MTFHSRSAAATFSVRPMMKSPATRGRMFVNWEMFRSRVDFVSDVPSVVTDVDLNSGIKMMGEVGFKRAPIVEDQPGVGWVVSGSKSLKHIAAVSAVVNGGEHALRARCFR